MKKFILLCLFPVFASGQSEFDFAEVLISPTCFGSNDGVIELKLEGDHLNEYDFLWSNGEVSNKLENLYGGVYSVLITHSSGKSLTKTIQLERPKPLSIGVSTNHFGGETRKGSVSAAVNGGTGQFSFSWSNGKESNSITDLDPGYYTLEVKDERNCKLDITVEIKNRDLSADISTGSLLQAN